MLAVSSLLEPGVADRTGHAYAVISVRSGERPIALILSQFVEGSCHTDRAFWFWYWRVELCVEKVKRVRGKLYKRPKMMSQS